MASFVESGSTQSQGQSQGQDDSQKTERDGETGTGAGEGRDWDRTWHDVTSVLKFEDGRFEAGDMDSSFGKNPWLKFKADYISRKEALMRKSPGVEEGVKALLSMYAEEEEADTATGGDSGGRTVPSLVEWYTWEVKRHYLGWLKPTVQDILFSSTEESEGKKSAEKRLRGILERLRTAWEVYVGVGRKWVFTKVNPGTATPRAKPSRRAVGVLFESARKSVRGADIGGGGEQDGNEDEDTEDDEDEFNLSYFTVTTEEENNGGEEEGEVDEVALGKFVRTLNSIISYSLRDPEWSALVYEVFLEWCGCILNSPPGMAGEEDEDEKGDQQEQDEGGENSFTNAFGDTQEDSIIIDSTDSTQLDDTDILLTTPTPTQFRSSNPSRSPLAPITPLSTTTATATPPKRTKKQVAAQSSLLTAWSHLQKLSLGGSGRRGERVFAEVISVLVTRYIEGSFAGHWANEDEDGNARDVTIEIGEWIEHEVGGLVRLVLVGDGKSGAKENGKSGEKEKKERALARKDRNRVLSPRASFRASELGIGGGSIRRRGAARLSIDGVMLGATPSGSMRRGGGGGLAALAALAEVDVGKFIGKGAGVKKNEQDAEGDDVGDVVLRKEDIEGWKKMALGRLGRLRVRELFEIVVDWPDSIGGVMDLRAYITSPQTRMHLTTTFTTAINNRILHPAASTTDILRVYISLIRAFSVLDPRGVLLDRVTRGIRRYLREREDTVRVIVKGLMGGDSSLVKREDEDNPHLHAQSNNTRGIEEDDLADLAEDLMHGNTASVSGVAGLGDELDFDDMSWVPDPIDAGPEYRRIKGTDVVGSLISLYESKEVFVKEFQAVLAERLLECRDYEGVSEEIRGYEPEIQTLELLRGRFGEGSVQGCDVMLRDIQVGARVDANVRREESLLGDDGEDGVQFHAKILSHLFWPGEMKDEMMASGAGGGGGGWGGAWGYGAAGGEKKHLYKLPPPIKELQEKYERGFEKLNGKRKLEWRDALGYVRVELELEDRIVEVRDARPWCVVVINAFGQSEGDKGEEEGEAWKQVKKTIKELRQELEMDESLVRRAVAYWVSKGVLKEVKPGSDIFIVVERLGDDTTSTSPSPTPGSPPTIAAQSQDDEQDMELEMDTTPDAAAEEDPEDSNAEPPLSAEKQVYAQFIVGMLTNAPGPMGLDRIMMMLGMLVPGGVRCGGEEMGELLERLRREGKVEGGEGEGGWRGKGSG